jgi:hypothetical protein
MTYTFNATNATGTVVESIAVNVTVPKASSNFVFEIPLSDIGAWLDVGLSRVLNDAHAGVKADEFADPESLRAACFAAIEKRMTKGPLNDRAARGEADPIGDEMTRIIRATLKKFGVPIAELKGHKSHVDAFIAKARAMGGAEPAIAKKLDAMRAQAAAIVAARAAAAASGPTLDDLLA